MSLRGRGRTLLFRSTSMLPFLQTRTLAVNPRRDTTGDRSSTHELRYVPADTHMCNPAPVIIILCRAPAIANDFELAYGRMGHHTTCTGARTRARQYFGLVKPLFGVLIRLGALGCSRPT